VIVIVALVLATVGALVAVVATKVVLGMMGSWRAAESRCCCSGTWGSTA
jgi:hypothetical protein